MKEVWYADDATGVASCAELRAWWDALLTQGQNLGHHPNASKTHLIDKEQFLDKAKELFTGKNVTSVEQPLEAESTLSIMSEKR